jgi:hypothetical protein
MDDALVTGPVECNGAGGVSCGVREKMLGAVQIAGSLLAGRGHEIHRRHGAQVISVNCLGQSQHGGQPAAVVADPWPHQACSFSLHAERRLSREDGIQVSADDDGWKIIPVAAPADHISGFVDPDIAKAQSAKAPGQRRGPLTLLAGRGGNLGDGDLLFDDGIIAARQLTPGVEHGRRIPEVAGRLAGEHDTQYGAETRIARSRVTCHSSDGIPPSGTVPARDISVAGSDASKL